MEDEASNHSIDEDDGTKTCLHKRYYILKKKKLFIEKALKPKHRNKRDL
jgi:hypothetical protein